MALMRPTVKMSLTAFFWKAIDFNFTTDTHINTDTSEILANTSAQLRNELQIHWHCGHYVRHHYPEISQCHVT